MKKISLKKRIVVIDLLIAAFAIMVPLLVFGIFNIWPKITNVTILYWVSFGVFPLINVVWLLVEFLRKDSEPSITYIELIFSFALVLVPYVNMVFALLNVDGPFVFILPLLFDIIVLILYVSVVLLLNFLNKKVTHSIETHKSEKIESVDVKTYENDDGSFKGAK